MDSYFPGWIVKVDGKEKPILRANHFYRGVQLDSGAHTLGFDYFPEGFKAGLIVSSAVCILLIALPLWRWRQAGPVRGTQANGSGSGPNS